MNQYKVGEKVWYNSGDQDRVYRIVDIKGNVAILESDNPSGPREKVEAYFTELKPHSPCINTNVIGRASCDIKRG